MHLNLLANSGGGGGGQLASLGILLLIPLAMYFLMIRPQRRRMREQSAMQSQLDVGDEVITTSGVYGFITGFDDDRIWLEIDDDVQVRISRAAIQGKVDTSSFAAEPKPPASIKPAATTSTPAETTTADATTTDTPARDNAG
ncbi:MAG: preprotein translocase subunit YajC [Ilumatobacteraceae bacterium]